MIVVAVVGILASIAWPSYQQSLKKSYRNEASAITLSAATRQEQYFSNNLSYTSDVAAKVASDHASKIASMTTPSGQHTVTITANDTEYTITATPANGDTECGALTYDSLGVKTAATGTVDLCW